MSSSTVGWDTALCQGMLQNAQSLGPQEAANPSREMGYVLQKDFSLPPHHTVSKPRTLQLSGEMKCCKLWGILDTETLRSSTVKCPIIPTCSIKAGPTVCDSSKERQPFMSLSTFTELVLDRHTWNSCTEFIVSTESCPQSLEKGILMAWRQSFFLHQGASGSHVGTHFNPPALLAYLLWSSRSTFHTKDVEVQARCSFSSLPFYTWPDL